MTTYVIWPKTIDEAFRDFYPTISGGEIVQDLPAATDTHFMIGTSRLTTQGVMALAAEFGDAVTFPEDFPSEFESNGFGA